MNYEEKYNEALKDMRVIYPNLKGDAKLAVEHAFPELAESEDERIRKWIVKFLVEQYPECWKDKKNKMLAYLEKQKEKVVDKEGMYYYLGGKFIYCGYPATEDNPYDFAMSQQEGKQKENPKSADSIPSDCVSDAKCEDRWHKVGDSLPDNGRLVLAQDCLGNTLLARYDGEGNWEVSVYDKDDYYCRNTITKWCEIPSEKQKEQKPITESKRLANEVIEYLIRCGYSPVLKDDSKKEHFHIDIPRHEDDFWHSEEYKHCRSVLGEYYMEGDYGGDTYTLYIWRVKKEQKPAEWSEEDRLHYANVLEALEYVKGCKSDYDKIEAVKSDIAWFKSLKPHWKPSEEHLSALLAVFNDPNNIGSQTCQLALTDLYEQLKKL